MKRLANMLTPEECKRANTAILHVKRRKSKHPDNMLSSPSAAVTAPSKVVMPARTGDDAWWSAWENSNWKNVIALDVEGVQLFQNESKEIINSIYDKKST